MRQKADHKRDKTKFQRNLISINNLNPTVLTEGWQSIRYRGEKHRYEIQHALRIKASSKAKGDCRNEKQVAQRQVKDGGKTILPLEQTQAE
ncbi:hypothetical protein OUZ56_000617 [Daphnia magna]|uniref:Uncharacterized protein n=1 Tax=Daphnia magna TaxID=35525 RepID=A0ABR0A0X7_9CRUS|nr:hypothetical protein OUZ56_000617 [Daphnia magna]